MPRYTQVCVDHDAVFALSNMCAESTRQYGQMSEKKCRERLNRFLHTNNDNVREITQFLHHVDTFMEYAQQHGTVVLLMFVECIVPIVYNIMLDHHITSNGDLETCIRHTK